MDMAVFRITCRVAWVDVDGAQVLHHSNYLRLFERVEEEFYEHLGLGSGFRFFIEREIWLPRVEVFCKYKAPARLGDMLEVSLSIEEVKEKAVRYSFTVEKKDGGVIVAEGYVVAVAADKNFEKAVIIPPEIAEKLTLFKNG
jgi:YbgC/YbaW family acyl-CoA thioester hydrolase